MCIRDSIDSFRTHQILVVHLKDLMTAALFLIHFHYQFLIVGNGVAGLDGTCNGEYGIAVFAEK